MTKLNNCQVEGADHKPLKQKTGGILMGNTIMIEAKRNPRDEFYTQIEDINRELNNYREQLRGMHVFMNCDDPEESNFWRYFKLNFDFLELKKITSTYYHESEPTYRLDYDGEQVVKTPLEQNGDFRSPEAIEILKEADIVVTNPPFSLFREYIAQLVEYNKKFIIMGNNNAITYKEVFPLIKDQKVWLGFDSNKTMEFALPDEYTRWDRVDEKGVKYGKVPAISWFTNIDIKRRHEDIILFKEYSPEEYPKYDNYDAIEVSRVANIPEDYGGIMGVPITFLTKHNPEQFEILGMAKTPICFDNDSKAKRTKVLENVTQHSKEGKKSSGNKINDGPVLLLETPPENQVYYTTDDIEGYLTAVYARILIRRKSDD